MILLLLVKGQRICINLRVQSLRTYLGLIWSELGLVCFKSYLMINYGLTCSGFTYVNTLYGKVNDTPIVTRHHSPGHQKCLWGLVWAETSLWEVVRLWPAEENQVQTQP